MPPEEAPARAMDGASSFDTRLERRLTAARADAGERRRLVRSSLCGPVCRSDDRELINFCSNDYLGLSQHPRVREALCRGAERYGVGSGGSSLICGYTAAHQELEEAVAAFTRRESALVFPSGYMANLALVSALIRRGETVYADRLDHASLLDACVLARARLVRFPHGEVNTLAQRIRSERVSAPLILSEGVFSMDGDLAPVDELSELSAATGATLAVDDAHGLGVVGPSGRGTLEAFGLAQAQVPVLIGTFGKAFGAMGAFVAGSRALTSVLVQSARPYLYTTALAPAIACAAAAALECARAEPWRRQRLQALIVRFRTGAAGCALPLGDSSTPIQPLLLGSNERAVAVSSALRARGFWVTAIRPPTVPAGTARLRITLSALHTDAQLDGLLAALTEVLAQAPRGGSDRGYA